MHVCMHAYVCIYITHTFVFIHTQYIKYDADDRNLWMQDPSYSKLFSSVLSTSNCGSRALDLFGFGPVVDDGFGIGYMIHPEVLLSSFRLCILYSCLALLLIYSLIHS